MRAALACGAAAALAPAAASASTWTVDDDGVQCPNAAFASIQAAVDQAAPWDTVVVCDGTYQEQSRPASGSGSPSEPGSVNGLTITKPLTLRGAGASKVTIMPVQSLTTLAGTRPFLRDGGGNVVTVSKQSRDATDHNTTYVDISGVTITSGTTYAEAGVAFFNTSGAVRNSVVGPLVRAADGLELAARPHGWGVVATNHYQGATEAAALRRIAIEDSLVTGYQSGGILFDLARGADGAPENLLRSGVVSYGYVEDTTVRGSGADALIPQTGVQYHAGQRGWIRRSLVTGNWYTPDPRRSVGVLLTDAETGVDPQNAGLRGFSISDSSMTGNGYGLFNATIGNDAVRLGAPAAASLGGVTGTESYWGCNSSPVIGGPSASAALNACQGISGLDASGDPSVELGFFRRAAPPLAAVPGMQPDAAPSASIADPLGPTIVVGEALLPVVAAADDFGVRSVELALDAAPVATLALKPYEFATGWTPGYGEIGQTRRLVATVTDSAGRSAVATRELTVVAPPGYRPISVDPTTLDLGAVLLGANADSAVTVENSGMNPLTLSALDVTGGSAFALAGGDCAVGGVLAPGARCTVGVRFAPSASGPAAGSLTVAYTAIGGGPAVVVALSGTGVRPAPPVPVNTRPPSIRGTPVAGNTLRCDPGSWRGSPTSYAYRWLNDGDEIHGATSSTYKVKNSDRDDYLRCRVTARNAAGWSAPATSAYVYVWEWSRNDAHGEREAAGPALVSFAKEPAVLDGGVLDVGTAACVRPGGCRVTASGTLTVGGEAFRFTIAKRIASGRAERLRAKLGRKARRALRGGGRRTVKAGVVAKGAGMKGVARMSATTGG